MKKYIFLTFLLLSNIGLAIAENNKYDNYIGNYVDDEKCEGYDFEADKVIMIDFNSYMTSNFKTPDHVLQSNGKKFTIKNQNEFCPSIKIKNKNPFKELPKKCSFLIGGACTDLETRTDYVLFQYKCTNKGCQKLEKFLEEGEYSIE